MQEWQSSGGREREHAPVACNRSHVHTIEQTPTVDEEETTFAVFLLGEESHHTIKVTLEVNKLKLPMEVDTDVAVSVISSMTRNKYFPKCSLRCTTAVLTT